MYNMRTITRKTNVRQHKRNTKNKEANVKQHLRKVVRPIAGVFALKDLNWKQSKKVFPLMNPNGDWDGDGVKNKKDCRPFDVERQHVIMKGLPEEYYEGEDLEKMRREALIRKAIYDSEEETKRYEQEQADANISDILARQRRRR